MSPFYNFRFRQNFKAQNSSFERNKRHQKQQQFFCWRVKTWKLGYKSINKSSVKLARHKWRVSTFYSLHIFKHIDYMTDSDMHNSGRRKLVRNIRKKADRSIDVEIHSLNTTTDGRIRVARVCQAKKCKQNRKLPLQNYRCVCLLTPWKMTHRNSGAFFCSSYCADIP